MQQSSQPFGLRLSEGLGCNAQAVARERPILFSAPMVRALLAGTKTQTRRVRKPGGNYRLDLVAPADGGPSRCPYGAPGDRLWVREAWMPDPPIDDTWASTQWAGCREGKIAGVPERFRHPRFCNYAADWLHGPVLWTPSIHMPRWASRIALEVTNVRVERLQDISEADAIAEGVDRFPGCRQDDDTAAFNRIGPVDNDSFPIARYAALWESINGPGSWEANPWVWVVEFQRCPNLQPNVELSGPPR
jgi:hypothetical protein